MTLFAICEKGNAKGLPALLIGGHAVTAHGHPGRVEKDVDDVIGLVKANGIDVADDEWREVYLKHVLQNYMKNDSESKDAPSPVDLDIPDWSGADWSNERVSPEAAYRFCEQYAREMPELVKRLRAQRRTPCPVEFVF